MKFKLLLGVLLVALISTSHAQSSKPKVEIFYETLNDAVRRFFVEQYKLVSDNFLDQIDLRLYPYGNTAKNNDGTYTCPYDGQQCNANKIHACLIKAVTIDGNAPGADTPIYQADASIFVNCFFKNRYANEDVAVLGEKCIPSSVETDWGEIHGCVQQDTTVNDIYGTITTGSVPTEIKSDGFVVRIGGAVSAAAKTNLLGEICKTLTKTDGICASAETTPTKVKIGVYYEAMNTEAGNYLVSQLGTYYHVLEDFVDIELVPYGNTQLVNSTYNCTLGDAQCISNKFQALVINDYLNKPKNGDAISGQNRAINFLRCLFQSQLGSVFSSLEICANQNLEDPGEYINYIKAIQADSDEVKTVFETMRTKTKAVAGDGGVLPRIPTITVNSKVDYNALDDLVQEACAKYNGPIKAGICTKVDVTVLYEALNHKSRTLFLEQLAPTFANLYNLINLKLIPAGRSVITPGHGFTCPGGADQCTAMKLQACALDYFWNDGNNYTDPIRQEVFQFIECTFKNKKLLDVMNAAELCSEQFLEADDWFTIHACFAEGTADAIFNDYIEESQSLVVDLSDQAIPIVLINGTNITDLSSIKATICEFFDDYHAPDYCKSDQPAKVEIKIFYESMSELSKYFFTSQYDPWYMYVEEMATIKLYPAGNVIESNVTGGKCDSDETTSACIGNKLQANIIDHYNNHDDDGDFIDGTLRVMKFLSCVFNHPNWKDNVYDSYEFCTGKELIFDDWFDILITAKSPYGDAIYNQVLNVTEQFKKENDLTSLDPVPWVTLDNQKHSKRAADDLLQTVCSQYPGDKPPECSPVQVEVYYSAINPQSRRFFIDQLIPVFRNLRERIHLDMIPYGVPDPLQDVDKECASKDKTCAANTLQACAIDKFFKDEVTDNSVQWDGKNQTLTFIYCMFKNVESQGDVWKLAEQCANNNIILGDLITECAKQQEGKDLLTKMRSRSMAQYESMEHAPWIVVNGLRSALAQSDLKTAVCDVMVGDKPDYCYESTPAKVKVEFHYSSIDAKSQDYVQNELYPHYRALEDIIDLDVIPFGLTEILSQEDGNYTLICPNGLNECRANLIHACLYAEYYHNDDDPVSDNEDEFDGKLQFIDFLNCYFSSPKYPSQNLDAAAECGEQIFGDAYGTARECAHSALGRQILLEFEEKKVNTLLPHLTYTPWMTVNAKHSYSIESHIQRTVCDAYTAEEKPHDCYEIYDSDTKPEVVVHYEPGDVGSKTFFTSSLMPDHVNEIGVIELVPFGRSTYDDTTKKCINDETCTQYMEHACLIDQYLQNQTVLTLQTIACTFGDQIADKDVVNKCVNQILEKIVPDAWEPIVTCMQSGRADELMKANAVIASNLTPKISHVPWVLINDEHNIEAEVSLCNELCASYYPADKPPLCKPNLLPVGIYYETKNQNVSELMLGQLALYEEYLDELGNFSFIPYGTTTNNNGEFTCSVDEDQCHANKACVLNRFYNQSVVNQDYEKNRIRTVGFLVCTFFKEMAASNAVNNAEACLDENFEGDLWRDINFCARGVEGDDLMKEMGRQTDVLDPILQSAPYVTIGSKYNKDATTNLFQALCNSYPMVKAPLCATLPNYAVNVAIYFSGNAAGQKYLINQVLPFYEEIVPVLREGTSESKLHSMINPDLVAWGNTKYDPTNKTNPFTCEDKNECFINRFFACATHYHGQEPRAKLHLIEFTLCFFSNDQALTNPQNVFNNCSNRVWIPDPYTQLEVCATESDQEAYDIFLKAKEKTDNNYPELTTFPAVTVNNIRDPAAESDLLAVVCKNYQGYDRPAQCEPQNSGTTMPTISIIVLSISLILSHFLL